MNVDKSISEIEGIFSPFMKNSYDVLAEKLDSKKESTIIWDNFMEYLYHGYIAEENPVIAEVFQKSLKLAIIDVINVLGSSFTKSPSYCDHLYQQALDASGILTKGAIRPLWASVAISSCWQIIVMALWSYFSITALLNVAGGFTVSSQVMYATLYGIITTMEASVFSSACEKSKHWIICSIMSIAIATIFVVIDVALLSKNII